MARTKLAAKQLNSKGPAAQKAAMAMRAAGKKKSTWHLAKAAIEEFCIPINRAELSIAEWRKMKPRMVVYRKPELVDCKDPSTGHMYKIYRVSALKKNELLGYMLIPQRYKDLWSHLSYKIAHCEQTWQALTSAAKEKNTKRDKDLIVQLRQNSGAWLVQLLATRVLVVEQLLCLDYIVDPEGECVPILNEFWIKDCRDWMHVEFEKVEGTGHKFLDADPIDPRNEKLFREGWLFKDGEEPNLDPPDDDDTWMEGDIPGLQEEFTTYLLPEALKAMKSKNTLISTIYKVGAELPDRWHEDHEPKIMFWSARMDLWYRLGMEFTKHPISYLHTCQSEEAMMMDVKEVLREILLVQRIIKHEDHLGNVLKAKAEAWFARELTWEAFSRQLAQLWKLPPAQCSYDESENDNPMDTLIVRNILANYRKAYEEDPEHSEELTLRDLTTISPMFGVAPWRLVLGCLRKGKQSVDRILRTVYDDWKDDDEDGAGGGTGPRPDQPQDDPNDDPNNNEHPMIPTPSSAARQSLAREEENPFDMPDVLNHITAYQSQPNVQLIPTLQAIVAIVGPEHEGIVSRLMDNATREVGGRSKMTATEALKYAKKQWLARGKVTTTPPSPAPQPELPALPAPLSRSPRLPTSPAENGPSPSPSPRQSVPPTLPAPPAEDGPASSSLPGQSEPPALPAPPPGDGSVSPMHVDHELDDKVVEELRYKVGAFVDGKMMRAELCMHLQILLRPMHDDALNAFLASLSDTSNDHVQVETGLDLLLQEMQKTFAINELRKYHSGLL